MEGHFVAFYSPGTFVAETRCKPIDSWDIEKAKSMAAKIVERYHAKPYAFQFITRERTDEELDSKETKRSPMYYINCHVETLEEVRQRNDPKEKILLSNMECNGWDRIVRTNTGWQWTQPLKEEDVVLA